MQEQETQGGPRVRVTRTARSGVRPGFALVDVLLAAVLLLVLVLGATRVLMQSSARTSDALERQTALGLARGQVERIRAAGPQGYSTPGESFRLRSDGTRDAQGPYAVTIVRRVQCAGGVVTEDTPASVLSWRCAGQSPVASYTVSVDYPSRVNRTSGAATSQVAIPVSLTTSWTSAELQGSSQGTAQTTPQGTRCPSGQSWNSEAGGGTGACACPSGMNLVNGQCACAAGTAWNGSSCVVATCAGPFTETQSRSDCQGGQIGYSTWTRTLPVDWCRNGSAATWGAWSETGRQCSCPASAPTWSGGACTCTAAASETRTRTVPCSAGLSGDSTITERRVRVDSTCSMSSTWTRVGVTNTCAGGTCPSGQTMQNGVCTCSLPAVEMRTRTLYASAQDSSEGLTSLCGAGRGGNPDVDEARERLADCSGMGPWRTVGRRMGTCACPSGYEWDGQQCSCLNGTTVTQSCNINTIRGFNTQAENDQWAMGGSYGYNTGHITLRCQNNEDGRHTWVADFSDCKAAQEQWSNYIWVSTSDLLRMDPNGGGGWIGPSTYGVNRASTSIDEQWFYPAPPWTNTRYVYNSDWTGYWEVYNARRPGSEAPGPWPTPGFWNGTTWAPDSSLWRWINGIPASDGQRYQPGAGFYTWVVTDTLSWCGNTADKCGMPYTSQATPRTPPGPGAPPSMEPVNSLYEKCSYEGQARALPCSDPVAAPYPGLVGNITQTCRQFGQKLGYYNYDYSACGCPGGQYPGNVTRTTTTGWGSYTTTSYECRCPDGQSLINGVCQAGGCSGSSSASCDGGQSGTMTRTCDGSNWTAWNRSSCACPTAGQIWNGTKCTCPVGQSIVGSACACPSHLRWDGSACVNQCTSGTTRSAPCNDGRTGTMTQTCTSGAWPTAWNLAGCGCPSAKPVWNGTFCTTSCGGGQVWDGLGCACPSGSYWIANASAPAGGACTTCTGGRSWNPEMRQCQCPASAPYWNGTVCGTCPGGQVWNGSACACPSGQNWTGSSCVTCSGGQTWNGSACTCPSGQNWTGSSCVTCSGGQTWSGSACACPSGQYWTGASCVTCAAPNVWDASAAVCRAPAPTGAARLTPSADSVATGQPVTFTLTLNSGTATSQQITASNGATTTTTTLTAVFSGTGTAGATATVRMSDGSTLSASATVRVVAAAPMPVTIRRLGTSAMWSGAAIGADALYLDGAEVATVMWSYQSTPDGAWTSVAETGRQIPLWGTYFPCQTRTPSTVTFRAVGVFSNWTTTAAGAYTETYDSRRGCS